MTNAPMTKALHTARTGHEEAAGRAAERGHHATGRPRRLGGARGVRRRGRCPAGWSGRRSPVILPAPRRRPTPRPLRPWPGGSEPPISSPSSSGVARSGSTMSTIRPWYMTAIRSARASTSSSSVETIRTAAPSSRLATIRRWMYSIEPTSRPRVGWAATSSGPVARTPAPRSPSAGCRPRGSPMSVKTDGVRTSKLATSSVAERSMASQIEPDAVRERRPVVGVEDEVVGDREARARSRPRADPRARGRRPPRRRGGAPGGRRRRRSGSCPATGWRRPVIASTSSVWPLPCTPAMATISPARTVEVEPVDGDVAAVVAHHEAARPRAPGRRAARASCRRPARPAGRPSSRPGSRGSPRPASSCPTTRPRRSTVIRSAISRTSLSLWVMKTIEVPLAFSDRMISNSSSSSWGVSTAVGSSRTSRSDSAVQRLDDLDALPDADRQVLDHGVGVDLEVVALGDLDDPAACRRSVQLAERPAHGLDAEHHVLGHREDRHEHEVLVDHPDAGRDGVARIVERDRPGRRSGSRPRPAGRGRTGRSSGSSCRPRSRRAARGSRPARRPGPRPGSR